MPKNTERHSGGVLEALFILLASITTTLLLLWIASSLRGGDLFSSVPEWLSQTVIGINGILTAGGSAAVIYWFIHRNTRSGDYYLIRVGIFTCTLIVLLFVVELLIPPTPPHPPTSHWDEWDLEFNYSIANSDATYYDKSQIGVLQKLPRPKDSRRLSFKPIPFDHTKHLFITDLEPPEAQQKYLAHARPRLTTPHTTETFTSGGNGDLLQICFVRTELALDNNRPKVTLNCKDQKIGNTTGVCEVSQIDQGYAEQCPPVNTANINFNFFSTAHANSDKHYSWAVRSLKTLQELPKEKLFGYTHFRLTSSPISPDNKISNATSFRSFISVNNNKILMEGWPQGSFETPFDSKKGLDFEFAIETLNFSGADGGYENLSISFDFLDAKGTSIKRTPPLQRKYVAIRRDSEQADTASTPLFLEGTKVQWSAKYSMPEKENKYEIFVFSTENLAAAQRRKNAIDNALLKIGGDNLIKGVIRPPLGNNTYYGVVLGLEQPNKQIQFTFNKASADSVCRYSLDYLAKTGTKGLIDKDVYRYEMQPRKNGQPSFRFCRDII